MYVAKKLIKHNGIDYEIGEIVPLDDRTAVYLVRMGVVKATGGSLRAVEAQIAALKTAAALPEEGTN